MQEKSEKLSMKVFYFGTVCAQEVFNNTVEKSRIKPSASAQNFEYALMKGFSEHPEAEVTAVAAESIATFPNGNRLFLRKRLDPLTDRISAHIVPAINLPGIKNRNHANGAVRRFRKWAKANAGTDDKCVLVYGIYPNVVKKLQKACKKHGCRIFAVMPDIPSTMFTYTKSKIWWKRLFAGSHRSKAVALQGQFDGYVYLTEAMKDEVAPGKPYTVVETIADVTVFDGVQGEKAEKPVLMYAGALYRKYGVDLIVDSFEKVRTDCELWLFGSGDYEQEIIEHAKANPRIKFFGRVSREEVLRKEKEAALLLNIRDPGDDYTKYSFPSKMIEYLLSGTPLLTTVLPGIPEEYYAHCFFTADREPTAIAACIDEILSLTDLQEKGRTARDFVAAEKNSTVQAGRILAFLEQQVSKG